MAIANLGPQDAVAAIVARAATDLAFRSGLLADAGAALAEFGVELKPGTMLQVLENTDRVVHLVLPARPAETELGEAELQNLAGAGIWSTIGKVALTGAAVSPMFVLPIVGIVSASTQD